MKYFSLLLMCSILMKKYSVVADTPNIDWSQVNPADALLQDFNESQLTTNDDNGGLQMRIVRGKMASPHQFPYQVGLFLRFPSNRGSWCGGSLISNNWVITAAHCLASGVLDAVVFLGSHNINKREQSASYVYVKKKDFRIHEQYNSRAFKNDIALIHLPQPVKLNSYIQSIYLPKSNTVTDYKMGIISGWGTYRDNSDTSTTLRYAGIKMIPLSYCNRYGSIVRITNICADGSGGGVTCHGDSGGPLVLHENGKNILVGLTSFGSSTSCERGYPVVFTRISSYLGWIQEHTGIR